MITAIVIYLIVGLILSVWGTYRWSQRGDPCGWLVSVLVALFWPIPIAVLVWHVLRS